MGSARASQLRWRGTWNVARAPPRTQGSPLSRTSAPNSAPAHDVTSQPNLPSRTSTTSCLLVRSLASGGNVGRFSPPYSNVTSTVARTAPVGPAPLVLCAGHLPAATPNRQAAAHADLCAGSPAAWARRVSGRLDDCAMSGLCAAAFAPRFVGSGGQELLRHHELVVPHLRSPSAGRKSISVRLGKPK